MITRKLFRANSKQDPIDLLIVGLGNPGDAYVDTRHNVGAAAVDLLANRLGLKLKKSNHRALTANTRLCGLRTTLAFPLTYMNNSGEAVKSLVTAKGVSDPAQIIVVHDELDLERGTLRLKKGGGLAGHNGLKSLKQHLKSADFLRVRIGIGRPMTAQSVSDYVLKRPSKKDRIELDIAVAEAADAIEKIAKLGIEKAMAEINRR